jgi:hypothetical protein
VQQVALAEICTLAADQMPSWDPLEYACGCHGGALNRARFGAFGPDIQLISCQKKISTDLSASAAG